MTEILSCPWFKFGQAIFAIAGTWLLAFGLKSVREPKMFDTSKPHPISPRFWIGLILITVSLLPALVLPFLKY